MAFTQIGRAIAILAVLLGTLLMLYAAIYGFEPVMGTKVETGEAIMLFNPAKGLMDGFKYFLFGVTLGVATEISSAVNQRQ